MDALFGAEVFSNVLEQTGLPSSADSDPNWFRQLAPNTGLFDLAAHLFWSK